MSNSKFELKVAKLAKNVEYNKPKRLRSRYGEDYNSYNEDYDFIDFVIGEAVVITNAGTTLVLQSERVFQVLFSAEEEYVRFMIDHDISRDSKVEIDKFTFVKSGDIIGRLYTMMEECSESLQKIFCYYVINSLENLSSSPEAKELRHEFHDSSNDKIEVRTLNVTDSDNMFYGVDGYIKRQNLIYGKDVLLVDESDKYDEYFISKQHKFIYVLLMLDLSDKRRLLGITEKLDDCGRKIQRERLDDILEQLKNSDIEGADDAFDELRRISK